MKHKVDFDPITLEDIQIFLQDNQLEVKPSMIEKAKETNNSELFLEGHLEG